MPILGGGRLVIESPLIQEPMDQTRREARCETLHTAILEVLEGRFRAVPSDLAALLRAVTDETKLRDLLRHSIVCPNLESFRAQLLS